MSLKRAYFDLHIAVILLAFTAILGDLISLSASVLVWWRTLIAALGIGLFLWSAGRINWGWIRTKRKIYGIGLLVALHWICFFGAIKLANASTALICFATISFFTAFIEPWITGRRRERHEVWFGLFVLPGIVLIAGRAEGAVLLGIVVGVLAALLTAVFTSLEKKWIAEIDPEHMTLMQMSGAWAGMCVWLVLEFMILGVGTFVPDLRDLLYLLVLGLVCTSLAWVLAARAIRSMTAYDSIMVINLEPVYGIAMALLLLQDAKELTPMFYAGATIIMLSVILHPIWQSRYART